MQRLSTAPAVKKVVSLTPAAPFCVELIQKQSEQSGKWTLNSDQWLLINNFKLLLCVCVLVLATYMLSANLLIQSAKWGHIWGSEDILADPDKFNSLFEASDLVLRLGL